MYRGRHLPALIVLTLMAQGCLTLRTARTSGPGFWTVRAQSSPMAPPPYLGSLSIGRGITEQGELSTSFAALCGALDEPGADLEWYQQLRSVPTGLDVGVGFGVGRYVIDPGTFVHASLVMSRRSGRFSPFLVQRLSHDLDGRSRWEAYLGVEVPFSPRFALQFGAGSRDLWNRDQWVVALGAGVMFGGGR